MINVAYDNDLDGEFVSNTYHFKHTFQVVEAEGKHTAEVETAWFSNGFLHKTCHLEPTCGCNVGI